VLVARAAAARPLLASRRGQVGAADAEVSRSRGGFWPVLGLEGIYQRNSTELTGPSGFFGDPSRQYVALARVTLAWNLFQGRETLAAEQRARVQALRARVEAAQAEQLVSAEIARARAQLVALSRSASLAQDALAAAEQGLRLARERLDAGAASQLEVRDATLKLAEAKLALVSAVVDHAVARADLNRAVGGTL
jgi:outer membrane protein TolC